MSLESKLEFTEMVRTGLEEILTVRQLNNVMDVLQDALSAVEVEILYREENGSLTSDDLLSAYLQAKRTEGLSEKTIDHYKRTIGRFLSFTNTAIGNVTPTHIRAYYAAELDRGIKESTVKNRHEILNAMFGWLWREGLIRKNPAANISTIKTPNMKKLAFSTVEIEMIKENCECARDKSIVLFLLATGCRIEETTNLNRQDIDFVKKEVTVFGKGKKERTVFMDDIACAALRRYLDERKDDLPALFIGKRKERFQPGGIRIMMKRLEKKSGVTNIHPHRFRRTLATNLANKGMHIQEIAYILGHANINTTMKYICVQSLNVKSHYQMLAA